MRSLAALALTAAAVVAAPASPAAAGKHKPLRGTVFRAAVKPVPFGPNGTVLEKFRAKARLVDGKRRDQISIRVRGLARNAKYYWHIHEVDATTPTPCVPNYGLPAPPRAHGFKRYPHIVTNRRGKGRAVAKARRFTAAPDKLYYVHVDLSSNGIAIGCGILKQVRPAPPR